MLRHVLGAFLTAAALLAGSGVMPVMSAGEPNILFVIMDDVGIDQLSAM